MNPIGFIGLGRMGEPEALNLNTGAELSFLAEELGLAPAAPPASPSNELRH
jgi:3-hydroxyisobutyrate dehydrogenase-like beta-hydroxyacid dehydrogenase